MTEITTEALAPRLPEGAIIKHVEHEGKPVVNVSDANGDWQAAIPVTDDTPATIEAVVYAAWWQEMELRTRLVQAEMRAEYQNALAELQEWHEYERDEALNNARP